MRVEEGVDLDRLRDEMRWALLVADKTYRAYGWDLVVTRRYEGAHQEGSLHYKNRAVDLRLPAGNEGDILWEIRVFLGPGYDVVVRSDHIHVEWDPK